MEEVFVPELASTYRWLSASAVLTVACGVWSVLAYRGSLGAGAGRKVGQAVAPLLCLVGAAATAASFYDLATTPIIVAAEDYLIVGRDTVWAAGVRRAYLEPVSVGGGYGPTAKQQELGVIEYADGTTLLLSQDNYDTRAVVEVIDSLMGG